jgi:predicted  nucleic acid-binding Zn-ribbon protein
MQIDGLRQEIVAITARNPSLEDQLRTADTDVTAGKSDLAAEVQKTHEARVCESDLRDVIDKLDRESRIAVTQREDFRHVLVTAGNEKQAMENNNAKLTADLDKVRERIGVDGQQLSLAKDIEGRDNALLAKIPMGVIQATNGKATKEVFRKLGDMREMIDKDKNRHVESTDGGSAYQDVVKDTW